MEEQSGQTKGRCHTVVFFTNNSEVLVRAPTRVDLEAEQPRKSKA